VHPAVLSAYEQGLLAAAMEEAAARAVAGKYALGREEMCVMCLVEEYIRREAAKPQELVEQLRASLEEKKTA
jgi:hypothetical protein